jgi:hypothetical protein
VAAHIERAASLFFVRRALLRSRLYSGEALYGTVAAVTKERLEAARDDLARLERRKADEIQDATFLRAEVAALRADVERAPRITVSEAPPKNGMGKDGDIHFQVEPSQQVENCPSAEMFIHAPVHSVKAALDQAAFSKKPIFLVIYDPAHSTQSKLAFSLGYFLEYQTTRRLVDEHFVSAVVPVTDTNARPLVPEDDPLENARWVVLRPDGQVLRTEGLYANPDEGLKRTREVIAVAELQMAEG